MTTPDDIRVVKWWALRVAYNSSMRVKHELQSLGMEYFLPLTYKVRLRGERRIKELVPAISNLIFVRCAFHQLADYHDTTRLPVRYIMERGSGKPLAVPERQMNSFIAVAGHPEEQIIYLEPDIRAFSSGQLVRITEGVFKGAVGRYVRLKGDRRVVVNIEGVAAVVTTFIHPSLIEPVAES